MNCLCFKRLGYWYAFLDYYELLLNSFMIFILLSFEVAKLILATGLFLLHHILTLIHVKKLSCFSGFFLSRNGRSSSTKEKFVKRILRQNSLKHYF